MSVKKPLVSINIIATLKYKQFVNPLLQSIDKYFLISHPIIIINLFTDEILKNDKWGRCFVKQHLIPSYKWPEATLLRYQVMTSIKYDCDYIYYFDVDYLLVSEINEDILGNIVAIEHPGFSVVGGGSWCDDKNSNAYTLPENRKKYFCGGTQGGQAAIYFNIMEQLRDAIQDDLDRGIICEHNDEQHLNRYLSEISNFKILDSGYCMPEPMHLRKLWRIDHLQPRILALDKNHSEIRN